MVEGTAAKQRTDDIDSEKKNNPEKGARVGYT